MSKGGGGGTNTVSTSSKPPAQFTNALTSALGQDQGVAATPLTQYPAGPNASNIVAPLNATQNQAFDEIGGAQGSAQPYINQADQAIQSSTTPLWSGVQQFSPGSVQQYESPYTSDVVNATEQQFNNQNAQAQSQLEGNAVSAGAWGGDRSGVAQGILGGQEALAQAPTIAGLENQGYSQALGEFNTQQQSQLGANEANSWLNSQAGANLANLGAENLNTQLTGANAELQAGGLQQQETQSQLNVPYQQFLQQQAYPFQTAGWLTSEEEGLSSTAGGTGTSTATENPSPLSTGTGLLSSGLGVAGLTGGFGSNGWLSGLLGGGAGASAGASAGDIASISDFSSGIGDAASAFLRRGGSVPRRASGGVADFVNDNDEPTHHRATGTHGSGVAAFDAGGPVTHSNSWLDDVGGVVGGAIGGFFGGPIGAVGGSKGGEAVGGGLGDLFSGNWPGVRADLGEQLTQIESPFPGLARGGVAATPHREEGGGLEEKLEDLNELGPGWAVGGDIGSGLTPMGSTIPDLSSGYVPSAPAGRGGNSAPRMQLDARMPQQQQSGLTLTQAMALGKDLGVTGGAASANGGALRRGGVARRDDGGDLPVNDIQAQLAAMPPGQSDAGPGPAPDDQISLGPTVQPRGGGVSSDLPLPSRAAQSGIAAPQRIDPNGVAAALNPGYASDYHPATIDPKRAADMRSNAPWLALLSAGAGMLGGRSLNGVSNIGAGIQQGVQTYAQQLGQANQLEAEQTKEANQGGYQKADLDMHARQLSDAADETRKRLAQADTAEQDTQAYRKSQLGLDQQRLNIEAVPQDVRTAQWLAKASPEEKQAYQNNLLTKQGVPPGLLGGAPGSGAGGPSAGGAPTAGSGSGQSGLNDAYLSNLPSATQATVKAMVEGRMAPPTSTALAKPYWQTLMSAANQYDPDFDQTTWGTRAATRKSLAGGTIGNGITALNTALGHAAAASDAFDQLHNGDVPAFNAVSNWVKTNTGDAAPVVARETVDALASEGRKVFAATGGGNLTELEGWQSNFPINGSPAQQKGALNQFVTLLDSRLHSVGEQVNRGLQRSEDPISLLSPEAQKSYVKLTGRQPQTGTIGSSGGQSPSGQAAAAPAGAPAIPAGITPDMIQAEIARRAALRQGGP